ncbi:MAG: amphi-Trp domain-containing protein [Deltaproteobacteria bacterium]|jgi:amphi-Trp domain-containing protein|nr:amphi-Trp domain-containing protein [Deltaproteobacteria bacterium]
MAKNYFFHNFTTDPDEVASLLRSMIEGFQKREMVFSSGSREVTLSPGNVIDATLETARGKGRVRLTLSFSWPDSASAGKIGLLFEPPELQETT